MIYARVQLGEEMVGWGGSESEWKDMEKRGCWWWVVSFLEKRSQTVNSCVRKKNGSKWKQWVVCIRAFKWHKFWVSRTFTVKYLYSQCGCSPFLPLKGNFPPNVSLFKYMHLFFFIVSLFSFFFLLVFLVVAFKISFLRQVHYKLFVLNVLSVELS